MEQDRISVGSCSIIGDRTSQQDSMQYGWIGDTLLALVCDGMGGMQGGELASQTAIKSIFYEFNKVQPLQEQQFMNWLHGALDRADQAVSRLTDQAGNPLGGGTTCVAAMVKENRFYWGSVGDSIIYYLRGGRMNTVNRMHNYNLRIDEMLSRGEINDVQAREERRQGEALISFLGMGGLHLNDTALQGVEMCAGDVVVLASDGVYKSLDSQQVQAIIEESGENMEIAAKRICNEAYRLATAKQDNTTVIAIRCER